MNYQWHYDQLIITRKSRIKEDGAYYERHHIIPRSMRGDDSEENLIFLTAREHFIAHWLLWRIHRNRQMAYAFRMMCNKNRTSSRVYAESVEAIRLLGHTEETKLRMSKSHKGKIFTDEHKKNIAKAQSGKTMSDEQRQKVSDFMKGNTHSLGYKHTPEAIEKIRDASTGREFSG